MKSGRGAGEVPSARGVPGASAERVGYRLGTTNSAPCSSGGGACVTSAWWAGSTWIWWSRCRTSRGRARRCTRGGLAVSGGKAPTRPGGGQPGSARPWLGGSGGRGCFGAELLETLVGQAVETSAVGASPATPPRVALISRCIDGQNAIVVAPAPTWPGRRRRCRRRAGSGRVPPARPDLEVPPSVIAAAIQAAQRGQSAGHLEPGAVPQRRRGVASGEVDVLVPNQVEAASYAGVKPDAVADWSARRPATSTVRPRAVIITLGGEGSGDHRQRRDDARAWLRPCPWWTPRRRGDALSGVSLPRCCGVAAARRRPIRERLRGAGVTAGRARSRPCRGAKRSSA